MIIGTGIVFLAKKTAPLITRAADGTVTLTLAVVDDIGGPQREPWLLHYSGPGAERFWVDHRADLLPVQPLHYRGDTLRSFLTGRHIENHSRVLSLALAPSARAGHSSQTATEATP